MKIGVWRRERIKRLRAALTSAARRREELKDRAKARQNVPARAVFYNYLFGRYLVHFTPAYASWLNQV